MRERGSARTGLVRAALAAVIAAGAACEAGRGPAGAALAAPPAPRARAEPEPFAFVRMSDPQLFWGKDSLDRWKAAVASANRLRPAFVVVGGDLVNADGDPAKRDAAATERMASAYLDAAKALDPSIPLRNIAGNHDVGNTPTPETHAWYEKRFGPPWYAFEHGGSLFVVLESNVLKHPERMPGVAERELAWLAGTLAATGRGPYRHKVVFMHHMFCMKQVDEKETYETLSKEMRARLLALFKEYGVAAVFSGHWHGNARVEVDGIEFVTTNAVARSLRGGPPGFRIVKVTPEGIEHSFHSWEEAPEKLP